MATDKKKQLRQALFQRQELEAHARDLVQETWLNAEAHTYRTLAMFVTDPQSLTRFVREQLERIEHEAHIQQRHTIMLECHGAREAIAASWERAHTRAESARLADAQATKKDE